MGIIREIEGAFKSKLLTFPSLYWLISASSLVWIPYIANHASAVRIGLSVFILVVVWAVVALATSFVKKHGAGRLAILVLPGAPCLLGLVVLQIMEMLHSRLVLSAVFISVFIVVYNFVLFFERAPSTDASDGVRGMMHRRYLEYSRGFLWAAIFVLAAYFAWEIQVGTGGPAEPFGKIEAVFEFLQLACIYGVGAILTFYAFNTKLRDIEGQK